jgi:actin-related protein
VLNWDAMETLLKYGLDTCLQHVDQKDYPILIAENNVRTATQKEKVINFAFLFVLAYIP